MAITHREITLSGTHVRLEHPSRGPVHVFQGIGHAGAAGFCVYLHGLRISTKTADWYVDQQWTEHGLQRKFIAAGSSATLVVPAARASRDEGIRWPSLRELVEFVGACVSPDDGPVHAIAHSNAYVNVERWLDDPRLRHVTLLDALYGYVDRFTEYARRPAVCFDLAVSANGQLPHRNARAMVARIRDYRTVTSLAAPLGSERFLYAPIERMSHMSWVTTSNAVTLFVARNERIRSLRAGAGA